MGINLASIIRDRNARSCRGCMAYLRECQDYRSSLIDLAIQLCEMAGKDPYSTRGGCPSWFRYVPKKARKYFCFIKLR